MQRLIPSEHRWRDINQAKCVTEGELLSFCIYEVAYRKFKHSFALDWQLSLLKESGCWDTNVKYLGAGAHT